MSSGEVFHISRSDFARIFPNACGNTTQGKTSPVGLIAPCDWPARHPRNRGFRTKFGATSTSCARCSVILISGNFKRISFHHNRTSRHCSGRRSIESVSSAGRHELGKVKPIDSCRTTELEYLTHLVYVSSAIGKTRPGLYINRSAVLYRSMRATKKPLPLPNSIVCFR